MAHSRRIRSDTGGGRKPVEIRKWHTADAKGHADTEGDRMAVEISKWHTADAKGHADIGGGRKAVEISKWHTADAKGSADTGGGGSKESIYGGTLTELGEFLWMAALEYKSTLTGENAGIRCGGSIINNRYVLTAANCITSREFELINVWLGEWKIFTDPDCVTFAGNTECADNVRKVKLKEQFPHPNYSKRTGHNDIGLLRLAEDVKFTDYIRPINLPSANPPNLEPGTLLTVSGWGVTENGTSSDVKLKVEIPLLANEDCNRKLSKPVTENQLCAGGEEGKDSCQGDTGSPLMRTFEDAKDREDAFSAQRQWYLEGIVSRGVGCGRLGIPAIYTRVSQYTSWISNITLADS